MLPMEQTVAQREYAMSHAALKLVALDSVNQDSLKFERRQTHRRVISGKVTSLQQSADPDLQCNRICSLQLLDISDAGLGAIVEEPIEPGSPISIFFPPHGPEQGFDRYGQVVRCVKRDQGHQIGIRFTTKSAA